MKPNINQPRQRADSAPLAAGQGGLLRNDLDGVGGCCCSWRSEAGSPGLPLPGGSAGQLGALMVFIVSANGNEAAGGGGPSSHISDPSTAPGPPDPGAGASILSLARASLGDILSPLPFLSPQNN